jgi:putative restriction endonuclease
VQAAHIRPVEHDGPDTLRNGLALSGTAHWMFDRGLVSVDDDLTILVARDRLPEAAARLLNPDGRLRAPAEPWMRPHPRFLAHHRDRIFKG